MKLLLGKMERFLESLVEGLFGRDADSLPAAILRRLAAEMERGAVIKGGRRWAPPECRILLTREAMRLVLPIHAELEEELRAALARVSTQAGFGYPSPLRFKFSVGDGQGVAVLSTSAVFSFPPPETEQEASISESDTGPTKVYRHGGRVEERAWFRIETGPEAGRETPLIQGKMVIGRHNANHVVLNDPNVSRNHASVIFARGHYYLADLGSTNGLFINGRKVRRHQLRDGDFIKIGRTVLVFHSSRPR